MLTVHNVQESLLYMALVSRINEQSSAECVGLSNPSYCTWTMTPLSVCKAPWVVSGCLVYPLFNPFGTATFKPEWDNLTEWISILSKD